MIPTPDDAAGELPKAYVVKSSSVGLEENDRLIIRSIQKHVEQHKARHKWLKGGTSLALDVGVAPKLTSLILRCSIHRCYPQVSIWKDITADAKGQRQGGKTPNRPSAVITRCLQLARSSHAGQRGREVNLTIIYNGLPTRTKITAYIFPPPSPIATTTFPRFGSK